MANFAQIRRNWRTKLQQLELEREAPESIPEAAPVVSGDLEPPFTAQRPQPPKATQCPAGSPLRRWDHL